MAVYLPNAERSEIVVYTGYYIQYTSLMLLILTFVIGAFCGQKAQTMREERKAAATQAQQKTPENKPSPRLPEAVEAGVLTYTDLFSDEGAELNDDKVEALITVLKSHDLDAQITIGARGASDVSSHANMGEALARAVALSRRLAKDGVPANAFDIQSVSGMPRSEVKVRFVESRGE